MDVARDVFSKKRAVFNRLASSGFTQDNEGSWTYTGEFMDGDLTARVEVSPDCEVSCTVFDTASGDEYLPMNIEAYTGAYVGQAREEYRTLLKKIADLCFDDVPFITDQANHISAKTKAEFGVDPEFPFTVKGSGREKEQDKGSAVFRHKDTGKWFAIIMTISGSKLEGYGAVSDKNSLINVMNVKIYPDELERLLDEPGLYRCYHMNKKQWITIALDGTAEDERIMELLKGSFSLTSGGSLVRRRGSTRLVGSAAPGGATIYEENGERRYWLIPSNPSTFDVAKGFRDSGNDTLDWHHRINVMPGDIVYIYQTEPVASIMYRCEVLDSYLPKPTSWGTFAPNAKYRMVLKRLNSFEKGEYPRSWMNEKGVAKTVRGQRSAPPELAEALEKACSV